MTLTFDDIADLSATTNAYGLQFEHSSGDQYILNGSNGIAGYPTGKLLAYYAATGLSETVSIPVGRQATFAVQSLDLSGWGLFLNGETLSISITGTGLGADNQAFSISKSFSVTQGQVTSFGGSMFTGFTGLKSLTFSGVGDDNSRYVGVDNIAITITPVPEPETFAMLLGGLALLGAAVRRRTIR